MAEMRRTFKGNLSSGGQGSKQQRCGDEGIHTLPHNGFGVLFSYCDVS